MPQAPAVAKPAHATPSVAAAARHAAALRALIDTASRPGARQAWASHSPEQADRTAAAERARGLLATVGAREVNLVRNDGFNARDVMIDRDGTEHVRMERSYEGLPVIGGDMVVHSRDGQLLSVTQGSNMHTALRPNLQPAISASQAQTVAAAGFDGQVAQTDPAKLVVYARNGMQPTLAYQVGLNGARNGSQDPGVMSYFVDARTGGVLEAEDRFQTAAANGTAKTLTLGNVGIVTDSTANGYRLVDVSRGGARTLDMLNKTADPLIEKDSTTPAEEAVILDSFKVATLPNDADNVWGNNATSDRATAAVDAHYGIASTWDYYAVVHGRRGLRNDGQGIDAYVHYGNGYFNAGMATFSNGTMLMIYGDGDWSNGNTPLVALDVAGHEMSHGVNDATAKLGYYNVKDSGGVNEANSDIFGTLVEFSTGNASDTGDYLIGEKIYPASSWGDPNRPQALRKMFDQASDGGSINCYPAGGFSGSATASGGKYDPHNTSGVGNRFAYLLAEGAVVPKGFAATSAYDFGGYTPAKLVCNGDTSIVGIGRAKLGAIWYRALTKYFVSSTDYPGARAGTLQAAADLYGANSTEYKTVARAWSAAGVN
ncbi:M4 family metallopeptidase [Lysobacter sp. K5869]|nr:M4 family metallopeptidase [Lysobacter sp. K5869]